jgi:exodeoxyribonuclease-3
MVKLATWNVNSLRVRLPQVLDWLIKEQPDVLALQETKLQDPDFPVGSFQERGYQVVFAGQKTYNGVALVSREPGADIVTELPGMNDAQRRLIGGRYDFLTLLNVYVPNGAEVGSEKYQYKLNWLACLSAYVERLLKEGRAVAVLGDLNIAPEDSDVYDPKAWEGQVLVSEPERAAFRSLLGMGLKDSFRLFEQPPGSYSWWDYRAGAFRRNQGLRIDHILVDASLSTRCRSCWIDKGPRGHKQPSDHAPVVLELEKIK